MVQGRKVMANIAQRGAAKLEQALPPPDLWTRQPSWDDIRVFLGCATQASFRKAASQLHVSSSTVVRRIERLEHALGVRLFNRLPEGVSLTPAGQSMLADAEKMERAIFDLMRSREQSLTQRVTVGVSITEGLGSYWVMPQLVRFQRQNPMLHVKMNCAMESADVLRLEADIAVQLIPPESQDLVTARLGRLHIYPFAARSYLDTYGTPTSPEEMRRHRIIRQVAPQLDDTVWKRELKMEDVDDNIGISTNASTALLYAIENGAGIGGLPTYVAALNDRIVPVDIGKRHSVDIWLAYHPELRKNSRKAHLIAWLKEIFDPHRYPWFADDFIHPSEFRKADLQAAR